MALRKTVISTTPNLQVPRRIVLSLISGAALAGGLGATSGAWAKVAQQQAGYKPNPNGANRCDKCAQFQPPTACKIVDGQVSPLGSCNYFSAK